MPEDRGKNLDLSASLSELKEALKETAELSEGDDSISTAYAKTHADSNVEIARRNLEQDPDNPMLQDWLAFNLYASGRYEEALELYRKCLERNPDNPDQHYYLGNCYYKLGDTRRAAIEWRLVVGMDGTSRCARKARDKLEKVLGEQPPPQ